MDALWSSCDLIQCLTLRERPERRAAAEAQFAAVGLGGRVTFLEQERDAEDGKRGCFNAHQQAAREALRRGARRALTFEDDVEFLPQLTPHSAARAAKFLGGDAAASAGAADWHIFFLGHFPRKMELTAHPDIVKVRSMDAHAYVLSPEGAAALCALSYAGDQVDVHFHYQDEHAYALYPMVAVQTPGPSDTEGLERAEDWNDDKLRRERELYSACVQRKALAAALGTTTSALAQMGVLSGPVVVGAAAAAAAGATAAAAAPPAAPPPAVAAAAAPTPIIDDTFDWVLDWAQIEPHVLPAALALPTTSRVVDIGCGYSTLPLHLATVYAAGGVLALDREQTCVDAMASKYSGTVGVQWRACDVCSVAALSAAMEKGSADLVFDKGTLDCAIVEDDAARLLLCVDWLMAQGGCYVVFSFRKPALLRALLSCDAMGWDVRHTSVEVPGRDEPASCCVVRRAAGGGASGGGGGTAAAAAAAAADLEAITRHTHRVLDQWYTQENPLLTTRREQQLRDAWADALARGLGGASAAAVGHRGGVLPLAVAYELVLTAEERTEITLPEFEEDIATFLAAADVSDSTAAKVSSDHDNATVRSRDSAIDLAQALAYLTEQQ